MDSKILEMKFFEVVLGGTIYRVKNNLKLQAISLQFADELNDNLTRYREDKVSRMADQRAALVRAVMRTIGLDPGNEKALDEFQENVSIEELAAAADILFPLKQPLNKDKKESPREPAPEKAPEEGQGLN